jgi:hypothetical protein
MVQINKTKIKIYTLQKYFCYFLLHRHFPLLGICITIFLYHIRSTSHLNTFNPTLIVVLYSLTAVTLVVGRTAAYLDKKRVQDGI